MAAVSPALKTQELFLRWLALPEVQVSLRSDIDKLVQHRWAPTDCALATAGPPRVPRPFSPESPPLSKYLRVNRRKSGDSGEGGTAGKKAQQLPARAPRRRVFSVINGPEIPRFFFPHGKADKTPYSAAGIEAAFDAIGLAATREEFPAVVKAAGLPRYWSDVVFSAACERGSTKLTKAAFLAFWEHFAKTYSDTAAKFIQLLNPGGTGLQREHFRPLIRSIIDTHPSLDILRAAPEFHARYMETVQARIFYSVNRSWSGTITAAELNRSTFLVVLQSLDDLEDINTAPDYFSYEHFYVIYTSFWKLDSDHDLRISRTELGRYGDEGLNSLALNRLFAGTIARATAIDRKMTFDEFAWFILAEEDKAHPTALEFWFRVLDLDGDGVLSMMELEKFHEEQAQRLTGLGVDSMAFRDALCQTIDMVHPQRPGSITLSDLRRCKQASTFLNFFLNVNKFLDAEEKDPFQAQRESGAQRELKETDWQKFARLQYAILSREEEDQSDASSNSDLWD